jgi:PIN domain nuclease of toxin-antitoxin system
MRLLLDTHVLLWALAGSRELRTDLRRKITDPSNGVWVSAASVWEIAIKQRLGKLDAPDDLLGAIEATGFSSLLINFVHAEAAGRLPLYHDDPFDRMLIAQAQTEGLVLVSRDRRFAAYQLATMEA